MVPPNGESFARAGSTWIHWKSSIALAKVSMRSCVTSIQGETPTSSPTRLSRSRRLCAFTFCGFISFPNWASNAPAQGFHHADLLRPAARGAAGVEAVELGAQRLVGLDLLLDAAAGAAEVRVRR